MPQMVEDGLTYVPLEMQSSIAAQQLHGQLVVDIVAGNLIICGCRLAMQLMLWPERSKWSN